MKAVQVDGFTDEEMAVLSDGAPMVVTPYLDGLDDDARDLALRTALRSLVSRGVLDPPSPEALAAAGVGEAAPGSRPSVDLGVRGDVMSAITLRDAATAVVAVARTSTTDQDFWYAHVVDEITLVEEVDPLGMHRLWLTHTANLPEALQAAVLHPEAADGTDTGADLVLAATDDVVTEPPPELVARLGRAYLRADVVVLSRTDPDLARRDLTGLFTGPEGSWSMVASPTSRTVAVQAETVEGLRARLDDLAATATGAPARPEAVVS